MTAIAINQPYRYPDTVAVVERDGSPDESMVKYCLKSSHYVQIGDYFLNIGDTMHRTTSMRSLFGRF